MKYSSSIQTLRNMGEIALITDIADTINASIKKELSTQPQYTYYTITYNDFSETFQCNNRGYVSIATFLAHFERYL